MEQVKVILVGRSKKAIEKAKRAVLAEQFKDEKLEEALRYFVKGLCRDVAHPTLLSLACEAVGGNPNETVDIGAAFVLLTSAADIHDDIIDNSGTKSSMPTVYGKFGKDLAIIGADVLWIKGVLLLNEAAEHFPLEKRQLILRLIKQAFFDLGSAEAKEVSLRGKIDIDPEEVIELIKLKVSVAMAAAQAGAIIGNGNPQQIENLGDYGKELGVLTTIREEFINMFEPEELKSRFKNECLPLPILYAFQNVALKQKILGLLEKEELTETKLNDILELVYEQPEVRKLGKYMQTSVKKTINTLNYRGRPQEELVQLLEFTLQDLPS